MPTVADLDKLHALIDQLLPLTTIQRGELIRAQDWNTVVSALIEVARATLSEDTTTTVPPHEHPDQVAPGWLTPSLRSLIERGPLADPAADARLSRFQSRLDILATQMDTGSQTVTNLRDRLNDAITKQLAFVNDLNNANRKIQGAADAREDVLSLRDSLGTLQQNLKEIMAANLTVDGQPANLQAFADRLKGMEAFRDRLKLPNGDLLDAAILEHRLTDLTNTLVTQAQLDDALGTRTVRLSDQDRAQLRDQLSADLAASTRQMNEEAATRLRAEITDRLAGVDAEISRAVSDAIPGVRDATAAALRPEFQAALAAATEAGNARLEGRLTETSASLTNALGQKIDDVQRSIGSTIQAELAQRIPTAVADLNSRLDTLTARTQAAERRLSDHDQSFSALGTRIEAVSREDAAARSDIRNQITRDMDTKLRDLSTAVDSRLAAHTRDINVRIDTSLVGIRDTLLAGFSDTASQAAARQVGDMATTLRAEMHQAAQDEVAVSTRQMQDMVAAQLQLAFADLPAVVDTHVRTAVVEAQSLLDARLNDAANQIQDQVKSRVDTALAGISPQVASAVRESVDAQLPGLVNNAVQSAAPRLVSTEVNTQLADTTTLNKIERLIRQRLQP